jgi:tRNA G18 (ribose-2'-O)-methylase SpoU
MPVVRVTGDDDPGLAPYRDVPEPELIRNRGLFVAEGRTIVRRVIEDGRFRVRSLLVNDAAARDLAPMFESLPPDTPVLVCHAADFRGITGHDFHRGCLALVERPPVATLAVVSGSAKTMVVLEGVTDPDNVGSVFRNAAALGADGVLLSPTCCDPFYRKAVRTSMGAVFRVPFARAAEWPGALMDLRAAGFTLVALTPRQPSDAIERYATSPRPPRLALIVGTEGAGLSPAVESAADVRVSIPMQGNVDSVNLAVAVGIALFALRARDSPSEAAGPR